MPGSDEATFRTIQTLSFGSIGASMVAYLTAQFVDVRVFHFWKRRTNGKALWLRNNGSTMVSQLVDTFVVGVILLYIGFGMDFSTGLTIMVTVYVYKIIFALLDTPVIYLAVYGARRFLGQTSEEQSH